MGPCQGKRFSSNFMAGRQGNPFSGTWWKNIKAKLTRTCAEGEFDIEKVCCHEAFDPIPKKRKCHIPWAYIEHLKHPECDHDAKPRPAAGCPPNIPNFNTKKRKKLSSDDPSRQTPEAK